jgi:steroid 5-alpha reductase family enzyme
MKRKHDIVVLISIYMVTSIISIFSTNFLPIQDPLIKAGAADLIATIIIFIFSVLFNNSSVYDPYWSVAPVFLTSYWILFSMHVDAIQYRVILIFILILIWSNRLTYNFFRQWKGFDHEDWRYADYRAKTGKWYWAVSFTGIHLFPTVIVFIACIPIYYSATSGSNDISIIDILAFFVSLIAITIETCADNQMRRYLLTRTEYGKTFQTGLWKFTRHPNYFGEILFWWGIYLFTLSISTDLLWTIAGSVIITLLFIFVSIPLIEKRLSRNKPDFNEYQKHVSMLIPWFIIK